MALADTTLRVATFAAPLSRDGPGLLLRDILNGEDAQITATLALLNHVSPDILLLTDFDFDANAVALTAFSDALQTPYEHHFTALPNAGQQTGLDLDGDDYTGDARDALGYGRFLGDGGMALLSRYPILGADILNLSSVLWRDVPEASLPVVGGNLFPSAGVFDTLPVSSTGHWVVPIAVGDHVVTLLAFDATPPVFDGPEDFNGLRNRAELRLWEAVLAGAFGPVPTTPIVLGTANTDPWDGDGIHDGITALLAHPALQPTAPQSAGGAQAADRDHGGPPAQDTADWPEDGPGNLRVSYILPAASLTLVDQGVFWPAPDDPKAALLGDTGPHRLVWIDLAVPQ